MSCQSYGWVSFLTSLSRYYNTKPSTLLTRCRQASYALKWSHRPRSRSFPKSCVSVAVFARRNVLLAPSTLSTCLRISRPKWRIDIPPTRSNSIVCRYLALVKYSVLSARTVLVNPRLSRSCLVKWSPTSASSTTLRIGRRSWSTSVVRNYRTTLQRFWKTIWRFASTKRVFSGHTDC